MTDLQIVDLAAAAILLVAGLAVGLTRPSKVEWRWLLVAVGLMAAYYVLLSRFYRLVPDWLGGDWNWQGMAMALVGTLALAALPMFGWRRIGLKLAQREGSLRAALPVALIYCLFFLAVALVFPSDAEDAEHVGFQLTMPGFAEEVFYRGLLLYALDKAFLARVRVLGVDWGWGAVLSCFAFGLAHALGYSDGSFSFEPMIMALTALPSFIAVWLRYRTGSLLLPVVLHNFGNAIGLLV